MTHNHLAYLSLVLTCFVACEQPSGAPLADAPPAPTVETELSPLTPASARPRITRAILAASTEAAPPLPIDPHTPAQLAAAACAGGARCSGTGIPRLMAASGQTPIIPPAWTVPAWFVDKSNSIGCASDANSGTSATCSGGCSGAACPSGVGPLLTYQELNVHRWLCLGNPIACPRLQQNTVVTFLSNDTEDIYFFPAIELGAVVSLQGVLGTAQQAAACTLNVVTSKNRATPQELKSTFTCSSGAIAVGQMLVNTTHASRDWVYSSAGGGAFNLSQPLAPITLPLSVVNITEVDTWAHNDVVTAFNPVSVNIIAAAGIVDTGLVHAITPLQVYQLNLSAPRQSFGFFVDNVYIGGHLIESSSQRIYNINNPYIDTFVENANLFGGVGGLTVSGSIGSGFGAAQGFMGGIIGGPAAVASSLTGSFVLDADVILAPQLTTTFMQDGSFGAAFIDTSATIQCAGATDGTTNFDIGPSVIYGGGTVNVVGQGRFIYNTGAGAGAAEFKGVALQINGQTTVCKAQPVAGITVGCNLALNAALLDTNAGATSGCTFVGGGGSFCNFGL